MTTLLVANRGEIAVRIFRTASRLGMRTVAVYSDADANAMHVRAADTAVHIGPAPAAESYLRIDAIVDAASSSDATLVHPGYGFLAEDSDLADACERAGLTFVGPPSDVLRRVGDKAASRRLAEDADVPVLRGFAGDDRTIATLANAAAEIGYPVLVKPAAGGGGKGMAVVREAGELEDACSSARRIATAAFGDDTLILERYVEGPRHVEVQVFGDTHGNLVHLGERDCSLQRRHQKIWEEAPAPDLDPAVRARLHEAGVAFARAAGYVGAGTCEFLVARDGDIGFIEMNARLQVEHPVTEAITGLDLVELQLRVAMGEPLPVAQTDVAFAGHAIEVRVYAEDPQANFAPQAGPVAHVRWPDDARVDTGAEEGSTISTYYDPLVAKVIVHADDRERALERMRAAIADTELLGVRTNIPFLASLAADPVVASWGVSTSWVDDRAVPIVPGDAEAARRIAAAAHIASLGERAPRNDPWRTLTAFRIGTRSPARIVLRDDEGEHVTSVEGIQRGDGCHSWIVDGRRGAAALVDGAWHVWLDGAPFEFAIGPAQRRAEGSGPAHLTSPLPGQVLAVKVSGGDVVVAGQELVVIEAMKMEHPIAAPSDGVVKAVLCAAGDQVERGQTLVDLEPVGEVIQKP